jgi:HPt (histidine-containing phosphotransfer) domain-containing protein
MTKSKPDEEIIVHADPEIGDLIPGFLDNRRKDVKAIEEALESGDFEIIRVLGHSMKGAGGSYGFDAITDIGKALEEAAKKENAAEIQKLADRLSAYLKRVRVVYD